jgi:hypothetical protein
VTLPDEDEKPYYDKERKVWVFPGENPEDVAKPIAPPPTMVSAPTEPVEPAPSAPLDPLAALMAVPSSRAPPGLRRPNAGATGAFGSKPQAPPSAPPQFAVFKPKPQDEDH